MDGKKIKKDPTILYEEDIQLLLKRGFFNRIDINSWHAGFIVSYNFQKLHF